MIHISQWPSRNAEMFRDAVQGAHTRDRLENPFEHKWILHDYHARWMPELQASVSIVARKLCDVPLYEDDYFDAAMQYDVGDFLKLHYDATVHPIKPGLYKAVTGLLYLSSYDCEGGPLEFYWGHNCICSVMPTFGTFVVFTSELLHGNPQPVTCGTRMVATVSMMSKQPVTMLANRTKAFFVPGPNEVWTDEMYRLRDLRADPEHYSEAYKVGV